MAPGRVAPRETGAQEALHNRSHLNRAQLEMIACGSMCTRVYTSLRTHVLFSLAEALARRQLLHRRSCTHHMHIVPLMCIPVHGRSPTYSCPLARLICNHTRAPHHAIYPITHARAHAITICTHSPPPPVHLRTARHAVTPVNTCTLQPRCYERSCTCSLATTQHGIVSPTTSQETDRERERERERRERQL